MQEGSEELVVLELHQGEGCPAHHVGTQVPGSPTGLRSRTAQEPALQMAPLSWPRSGGKFIWISPSREIAEPPLENQTPLGTSRDSEVRIE